MAHFRKFIRPASGLEKRWPVRTLRQAIYIETIGIFIKISVILAKQSIPVIRRHLLWEYEWEKIDFSQLATVVIKRVIERGAPVEWQVIVNFYGVDEILALAKNAHASTRNTKVSPALTSNPALSMIHKGPGVILPETFDLLVQIQQDEFFQDFFLVASTALALQIGHRLSIDLDWFLWHFVPNEWSLTETAIELCDGCPSRMWTGTLLIGCEFSDSIAPGAPNPHGRWTSPPVQMNRMPRIGFTSTQTRLLAGSFFTGKNLSC